MIPEARGQEVIPLLDLFATRISRPPLEELVASVFCPVNVILLFSWSGGVLGLRLSSSDGRLKGASVLIYCR